MKDVTAEEKIFLESGLRVSFSSAILHFVAHESLGHILGTAEPTKKERDRHAVPRRSAGQDTKIKIRPALNVQGINI